MSLPILSSSSSLSFIKMCFPHEAKSSSLAIWKSNFHRQRKCNASYNIATDNQNIPRGSAKFQPTIWTDEYVQSSNSVYKEEMYTEKRKLLREEVRMMLCKVENEIDQLDFIDVLQRLGVDYHFSNEIKNILDNMQTFKFKDSSYATTLKFRLLRQHGYNISIDGLCLVSPHVKSFGFDVDCFQDEMGKFNKSKYIDVDEILALYEASFHSFEDEIVLDEARDFSTMFLKEYLNTNRGNHYTTLLINHALELPLHWRIPRGETQWYINAYQTYQNMSPILLQFAILDFNFLQSTHQEELKYVLRWWETCRGDKLSFARDRLVENFTWGLGVNFKLGFEKLRNFTTKMGVLLTIIDDLYETCGTLDELELFTEAIERWDLNYAMASLPDYMRICFYAIHNFVNELAFHTMKTNGNYIIPYLKKAWANQCKSYLIEAKWYHGGYTPSLEEYMENAWISIGIPNMLIHGYYLIQHSSNLEENSNLVHLSSTILRLTNDLGTYKREYETGDVPKAIQCYMNDVGASEEEACVYVKSMLSILWKKINKEVHCSSLPPAFVDAAVNLCRVALYMYQHGDGHTTQHSEINNRIRSLIFHPITGISLHDINS